MPGVSSKMVPPVKVVPKSTIFPVPPLEVVLNRSPFRSLNNPARGCAPSAQEVALQKLWSACSLLLRVLPSKTSAKTTPSFCAPPAAVVP